MSSSLFSILVIAGIAAVALIFILLVMTRLYQRSSKDASFVRTGFGGEKVILNGGALVFPVLHQIIKVNMTTLKLPVERKQKQALITKDRLRVDVNAEFFVRVKPDAESISKAAQTLGHKTTEPGELKALIEGKFIDALRSVAASMNMDELHEQRADFVQKVQGVVANDILKNGLELEAVSLTGLDQTNKADLDPNNAFDAEGLTKLTQIIESRRKIINDTEQETKVEIEKKNLDTTQRSLTIRREREYAEIETEREIANRRASQQADIAKIESEQRQAAETARITAEQQIETQQLDKEQSVATRDIQKQEAIRLAEQTREINLAERSKDESKARAQAQEALADAVRAEEKVVTARSEEQANRDKSIKLIKASENAEEAAIGITVAAKADRVAAEDRAAAREVEATAQANADKIMASGTTARYEAEAAGKSALNKAENELGDNLVALRLREALLQALPAIISAATEPMKHIDSIRVIDVNGLAGLAGASNDGGEGGSAGAGGNGSLPDQIVGAALRHRAAGPMIDQLMGEVGLSGGSIAGLMGGITDPLKHDKTEAPAQVETAGDRTEQTPRRERPARSSS